MLNIFHKDNSTFSELSTWTCVCVQLCAMLMFVFCVVMPDNLVIIKHGH